MRLPSKIGGFRSRVINALIDFARMNKPVAGTGILLSASPEGTVISVKKDGRTVRHPFEVVSAGYQSVFVTQGTWTRNGVPLTTTTDANRDYLTVTGLDADGTWYLYLQLAATGSNDARITPASVSVEKSQTNPDGNVNRGLYKVLATVTVTDGVAGKPEQAAPGNIADEFELPDAQTTKAGDQFKSVDRRTNAGGQGELEVNAFSDLTATTPKSIFDGFRGGATGYEIMVRDRENKRIHYATITDDEPSPPAGVEIQVIVDVRYDEDSYELQYKTQTITVLAKDENPSDWITFHEAAECEEDGEVSGPSQAIPEGSTQRYVPPA